MLDYAGRFLYTTPKMKGNLLIDSRLNIGNDTPYHYMIRHKLPKVIAFVGPTAAGKTDWALRLAKKVDGEIISADSRQVYKKMDIGTAKTRGDWEWRANWQGLRRSYFVDGIPHHLIDILDPGKRFTAAEFRDRAIKYIKLAYKNERQPILAGGTGLYISAVVDNFRIPRIAPNKKLRISLEEKNVEQLMNLLRTLDPKAAESIDVKNKRRIVRALEVCILTGEPFSEQKAKGEQMFEVLQIGVDVERDVLYERISQRVDMMVERGLVQEIEGLLKQKYSWNLPSMSGIGYRQFKRYFEEEITLQEATNLLKRDTRRYARRQLTWFRRDKRIEWFRHYEDAEKRALQFLQKEESAE